MTDDERNAFLNQEQPAMVGVISTVRNDGSPQALPLWYRWDGSTVMIWSDPTFGWVRRLHADPRIAFAVFEHHSPYRAVYIRGTAETRRGSLTALRQEIRSVVSRYEGTAGLDEKIDRFDRGTDKVIVTIHPTSVIARVNMPEQSSP